MRAGSPPEAGRASVSRFPPASARLAVNAHLQRSARTPVRCPGAQPRTPPCSDAHASYRDSRLRSNACCSLQAAADASCSDSTGNTVASSAQPTDSIPLAACPPGAAAAPHYVSDAGVDIAALRALLSNRRVALLWVSSNSRKEATRRRVQGLLGVRTRV